MLASLIGGRIAPSFTHNWMVKQDPKAATPASFDLVDRIALAATAVALSAWVITPEAKWTPWLELAAGFALAARFARWCGEKALREPLLWVLHLGYGWLSFGLLLLGFNSLASMLPQTTALHALTVGVIGTMTLAVMTRASLGHTGRAHIVGPRTTTTYALITLAAVLRLLAPLFGAHYYLVALSFAGAAWSVAFGLFALFYFGPLTGPRSSDEVSPPI